MPNFFKKATMCTTKNIMDTININVLVGEIKSYILQLMKVEMIS